MNLPGALREVTIQQVNRALLSCYIDSMITTNGIERLTFKILMTGIFMTPFSLIITFDVIVFSVVI